MYQTLQNINKHNKYFKNNILHQQVPLPVPCVNFTQITIKPINKKIRIFIA